MRIKNSFLYTAMKHKKFHLLSQSCQIPISPPPARCFLGQNRLTNNSKNPHKLQTHSHKSPGIIKRTLTLRNPMRPNPIPYRKATSLHKMILSNRSVQNAIPWYKTNLSRCAVQKRASPGTNHLSELKRMKIALLWYRTM